MWGGGAGSTEDVTHGNAEGGMFRSSNCFARRGIVQLPARRRCTECRQVALPTEASHGQAKDRWPGQGCMPQRQRLMQVSVIQECQLWSCCAYISDNQENYFNTQCSGTAGSLIAWQPFAAPCCQQCAPICCIWICMPVGWLAEPCTDRRHSCQQSLSLMVSGSTVAGPSLAALGKLCKFQRA